MVVCCRWRRAGDDGTSVARGFRRSRCYVAWRRGGGRGPPWKQVEFPLPTSAPSYWPLISLTYLFLGRFGRTRADDSCDLGVLAISPPRASVRTRLSWEMSPTPFSLDPS